METLFLIIGIVVGFAFGYVLRGRLEQRTNHFLMMEMAKLQEQIEGFLEIVQRERARKEKGEGS